MAGLRSYRAVVEATYLGGTLPDEAYAALVSALPPDISCTRSAGLLDVVDVTGKTLHVRPVAAAA